MVCDQILIDDERVILVQVDDETEGFNDVVLLGYDLGHLLHSLLGGGQVSSRQDLIGVLVLLGLCFAVMNLLLLEEIW